MSRLSDKAVLKGHKNRSKKSGGRPTFKTAHCEIGERNGCDAQGCGEHSHCNIGHIFVYPTIMGAHVSMPTIVENIRGRTWKSP